MAEQIISPGVFTRENDQSFIQEGIQAIGAAIVGPTAKGPVLIPTVVTSISQFENIFGTTVLSGSQYYTYLTNLTARSYFENGGQSMLIVRIMSGAFTPATSVVPSGSADTIGAFVLETLSVGSMMNNSGSQISGSLVSGSADNVRWEVSNVKTGSGTFDLYIRRGDDNVQTPSYLETWIGVNLDPNSPNYISSVIGDQVKTTVVDSDGTAYVQITGSYPNFSKYVRVKAVNAPTIDYLDSFGNIRITSATGSLPLTGSGSFSGGSNGTVDSPANFYDKISTTGNSQGYLSAAESGTPSVNGTPYTVALNYNQIHLH